MAQGYWDQYSQDPTTGGVTGRPYVDPSQLQTGEHGAGYFSPGATPSSPGGITFDPSQASPSSPMNGGGGIMGGSPGVRIDPTTGQTVNSGDPQQFFNQLFPGDTLTPDMLTQNEAALKAQGIELVRNAAGVPGKIKLPNGQVIDVIQGAGAGVNKKQWLAGDGGSGGGGGTLGSIGFGSFVSPIGQFTPPTAEDALNSPGLQFALSEANRMGQNSAAAKGTLLNGRFQQALGASNVQNALGGYNDVYNRALSTFGTNFGVQTRNQDAPYQKFLSLAQLGQGAAAAS